MMGVLVIFPVAAAIAAGLKKRFEETLFPAIGLMAITLALTGMAGALKTGVYIDTAYVIPSAIVLILCRKRIRQYVLTPGLWAFCLYFVFFLFFCNGRFFQSNAAITQYGPSIARLCETDSLRDDCLYYALNDPFPMGALWAYYCAGSIGGYSEWIGLFALDIFAVAALLPFFLQITSVKKESWQWCALLGMVICLPLIKLYGIYSSFDMVLLQAASMVYVLFMVYRIMNGAYRRSDSIFWAYGIFMACTAVKHGVYMMIPLLAGILAITIRWRKLRNRLLFPVILGCAVSFALNLYNYADREVGMHDLLVIPGVIMGCILTGVIISVLTKLREKGKDVVAGIISVVFCLLFLGIIVLVLLHGEYRDYVQEEVIEYTDKLIMGSREGEYVIGKNVVRIYDAVFLFILFAVSAMLRSREEREKTGKTGVQAVFRQAFICGVFIYLAYLAVLYVTEIRMPDANPIPSIAAFIAPVVLLSTAAVFLQASRVWKKDLALIISTVVIMAAVYSDPVGAFFGKSEKEYSYPVIHECLESGMISFTGSDRVFLMDPELHRSLPEEFAWEVFPAGAGAISGLNYSSDPYRWSAGKIQATMTVEEFEQMIREEGYTYVYLGTINDFFINTYHTVFAEVGAGMIDDAIYHVEYDADGQLKIRYIAREE